jgi:hypothetical protein
MVRFLDIKPVNETRFEYFATIIGFNETEVEKNDLLNDLFANFEGFIQPNLDAMAAMTAALEGLLVLPSFTTKQATNVLNVVDQLVNVTGQIEVEDDSLKTVTNKYDILRFFTYLLILRIDYFIFSICSQQKLKLIMNKVVRLNMKI